MLVKVRVQVGVTNSDSLEFFFFFTRYKLLIIYNLALG